MRLRNLELSMIFAAVAVGLSGCGPATIKSGPDDLCVATSCSEQGMACGKISDGCGRVLDCGTCPDFGTAPLLSSFSATPSSLFAGAPTDVAWTWTYSNNPTPIPTCTVDHGVGAVTNGENRSLSLTESTVFSLTCGNSAGNDTAQVTVAVATQPELACTHLVDQRHPSANDSNPGTEAQPWRTITKAANAAVAGNTVCVKAGEYLERVSIANSGSAGNWITFAAYPGQEQKPIIDGNNQEGHLISIFNKQYIRVSGFAVQNNVNGISYGIYVSGSNETTASHHIRIDHNIIKNTGASGIFFQYGRFRNEYVEGDEDYIAEYNDLQNTNAWLDSNGVAWMEGLEVNILNNFVMRHNTVRESNKEGISVGKSKFGRVNGNIVYGERTSQSTGGTTASIYIGRQNYGIEVFNNLLHGRSNGVAIATEDGSVTENVRVYNNIAYDTTIGFRLARYSDGGTLPKKDIFFINNVAFGNEDGLTLSDQPMENVVVRNNIVVGNSNEQIKGTSYPGVTADHNIVTGDPFVDSVAKDFHLKASASDAIDAGSSLLAPRFDFENNVRPAGVGYDIGAYEFTKP